MHVKKEERDLSSDESSGSSLLDVSAADPLDSILFLEGGKETSDGKRKRGRERGKEGESKRARERERETGLIATEINKKKKT